MYVYNNIYIENNKSQALILKLILWKKENQKNEKKKSEGKERKTKIISMFVLQLVYLCENGESGKHLIISSFFSLRKSSTEYSQYCNTIHNTHIYIEIYTNFKYI